jgi:predicted GNAT family N-acyltransferase
MARIIKEPNTQEEWDLYYDLRYRILRAPLNQPLGSERNEGDIDGQHFALWENEKIVAIARLDLQANKVCQVRFVAVEDELRGKGIGKEIMQAVEKSAFSQGYQKVILHARDYAVEFYKKLGYRLIEPSYKLFGVLQHFLMEKDLN